MAVKTSSIAVMYYKCVYRKQEVATMVHVYSTYVCVCVRDHVCVCVCMCVCVCLGAKGGSRHTKMVFVLVIR
jgi:hypothetical protein